MPIPKPADLENIAIKIIAGFLEEPPKLAVLKTIYKCFIKHINLLNIHFKALLFEFF